MKKLEVFRVAITASSIEGSSGPILTWNTAAISGGLTLTLVTAKDPASRVFRS